MNKTKIIKTISWVLVAVCMAVIFILSAQTGSQSEQTSDDFIGFFELNFSVDIVRTAAHCLEFAGLAVLVFNALYRTFGRFRPWLAFAVSALYAVSDEVHQLFVEGRSCQLIDILIDSFGAFLGIIGAMILGKILVRKLRRCSE